LHEIDIKLWRNAQRHDWFAEIDGKRYEGVAMELIEELVQSASSEAKKALAASASQSTH
jgi:hypothetical protein